MTDPKVEKQKPVPPFVQFCCAAVPMVFDDSLSYYEALCAMWKYLDETVKVINNNALVTEDFIAKVNELHEYVEHYFDNLNVQEEINNKLDQMAEDGTLQEIITAYIQANVTWTFDTVADMKTATNLVAGSYAQTLGFHAINDGGGATYYITDSGTADEMEVIAISDLYANLVYGDEINVKQLGAYGDGTHDDTTILAKASTFNKTIHFPKGTYINNQLIEFGNQIVYGDGQYNTFIKLGDSLATNTFIRIKSDHTRIKDLCLITDDYDYSVAGTTNTKVGLSFNGMHHNTIENVRIIGFDTGIYANRSWINTIVRSMFLCCNKGIYGDEEFNAILIEKCLFNSCVYGLYARQGHSINVMEGSFEENTTGLLVENKSDLQCNGCYFEKNTTASIHINWDTSSVDSVKISNCSFWTNDTCECVIKFHAKPEAYIVLESCDFRNNESLSTPIPVFIRTNYSLNRPHLVGCFIGASYSLEDIYYLDTLKPEKIDVSDWFTPASGVSIVSNSIYEDNKHIYGSVTFKFNTAPSASQASIGTFKSKYAPANAVNTFGALSESEWQQSSSNLAYVYMSTSGITMGNGDSTCTHLKVNINYVRA